MKFVEFQICYLKFFMIEVFFFNFYWNEEYFYSQIYFFQCIFILEKKKVCIQYCFKRVIVKAHYNSYFTLSIVHDNDALIMVITL